MMIMMEEEVIGILRSNGIDVVSTLPCGRIRRLLELVHSDMELKAIRLNREEDGVGISAGAYLGGGKPAMIIQSSGLGNCFNALLSLSVTYRLPLPILSSWRGVHNEDIPAQIPFNKALPDALRALGIPYKEIRTREGIEAVDEVIKEAYENSSPCVALLSPAIWTGSDSEELEHAFPERNKKRCVSYEKEIRDGEMTRYEAMRIVAEFLDGECVVTNIGIPSKELYAIRDRALNFYMLGSYGQASAIGLGLTLSTKREVIVLDGDGSLLTTSVLPTIAAEEPHNLSIFCMDNGTLGSTGDQLTDAYTVVDMELMAIAAGIENTVKVHTANELRYVLEHLYQHKGPRFIHVIVKPGNQDTDNIKLSPEQIKRRFMEACVTV